MDETLAGRNRSSGSNLRAGPHRDLGHGPPAVIAGLGAETATRQTPTCARPDDGVADCDMPALGAY